jgi:hypothetical protein
LYSIRLWNSLNAQEFDRVFSRFFASLEKNPVVDLSLLQQIVGERLASKGNELGAIENDIGNQARSWEIDLHR